MGNRENKEKAGESVRLPDEWLLTFGQCNSLLVIQMEILVLSRITHSPVFVGEWKVQTFIHMKEMIKKLIKKPESFTQKHDVEKEIRRAVEEVMNKSVNVIKEDSVILESYPLFQTISYSRKEERYIFEVSEEVYFGFLLNRKYSSHVYDLDCLLKFTKSEILYIYMLLKNNISSDIEGNTSLDSLEYSMTIKKGETIFSYMLCGNGNSSSEGKDEPIPSLQFTLQIEAENLSQFGKMYVLSKILLPAKEYINSQTDIRIIDYVFSTEEQGDQIPSIYVKYCYQGKPE